VLANTPTVFIFCGVISLPGAFWGYYAIPDNPYNTKARWLRAHHRAAFLARMQVIDRRQPTRLSWAKMRKIFTHWPIYIMTLALMCVESYCSLPFQQITDPTLDFIALSLSPSTILPSGSSLSIDFRYIRSTFSLRLPKPWLL
jgi:hypothetical protein